MSMQFDLERPNSVSLHMWVEAWRVCVFPGVSPYINVHGMQTVTKFCTVFKLDERKFFTG